MNKYERLQNDLKTDGIGKMKVFGQSMKPKIQSGSLLTFQKCEKYEVGDIVFCKVHGKLIDAHLITKIHPYNGYMIANNHGYENGWTKTIFGKVTKIE